MKQQDRTARRLSGPVFLRREIKKNDFFSVLALSVSHCSTAYSLFLALPFSPNRRKSAKGRTLGKTGSFAVLPKPLTLGEVALRSNDGEGKAADNQILPWAAVAVYGAGQKSFFSKFGETACFLPKSFSQMAIVKQLVKDLYCSQERSVREEQTE